MNSCQRVSFITASAVAAPVIECSNAPTSLFERRNPRGPPGQIYVYVYGNDACNGPSQSSFEVVSKLGHNCYPFDNARSFHTAGSGCTVEVFPGRQCDGDSGMRFMVNSDDRVCHTRQFTSAEIKC